MGETDRPAGITRVTAIVAVALILGLLAAGCGSSAHPGGHAPVGAHVLALSPAQPNRGSELHFTFTAPVASGVHGAHVISYSLSVSGEVGADCVAAREAASPTVAAGALAEIAIGPAQLHAPWCVGDYTARVLELRSPHCTGSAPCPQYIAVVEVVARRDFRITRG